MIKIPGIGDQKLTWTPYLRAGDSSYLRLEITSFDHLNDRLVIFDGGDNKSKADPQKVVSDYDYLLVESRLEVSRALIEPGPEVLQTLRPGEKLNFSWNIKPDESGKLEAEIWVYLHLPIEGGGAYVREPITIQNIDFISDHLYGFSGQMARISGIIGCGFALLYLGIVLRGFQKFSRNLTGV